MNDRRSSRGLKAADLRRGPARWALMAPLALFMGAFFVIPVALMAVFSFRPSLRGGPSNWDWRPTLEHYRNVLGSDSFLPLLGRSVLTAMLVASLVTVLAYPVAYFLAFRAGKRAGALLTILIIPFWISYLLRIISWKVLLGPTGAINSFFSWMGLVDEPVTILLYSRTAVVITLIYVWLPFVSLPIYATLLRLDRRLLEAASNLGAPPATAFRRVTLPLSLPGVAAAFLMVFIPTVGEYVAPLLVGGSQGALYGNIVEIFFGDGINWPLGSALAMVMATGVLILFFVLSRTPPVRRFISEL